MNKKFGIISIMFIAALLLPAVTAKTAPPGTRASDLSEISLLATVPIEGMIHDMAISGDYLYISADNNIHVIDISQPQSPSETAVFSGAAGSIGEIKISGNYLYTHGSSQLLIIDISSPDSPTQVAYLKPTLYLAGIGIVDHYLYMIENIGTNLTIIDIADPTNPVKVKTIEDFSFVSGIYIAERYAYLRLSTDSTIQILALSDPTSPQLTGSFYYGYRNTGVFQAGGNYLYMGYFYYLAQARGQYFYVFDISDPSAVSLVSDQSVGTDDSRATSVFRAGKYVLGAYANSGTWIFDVSDPVNPVKTGRFNSSGNSGKVTVYRDLIFQLDYEAGIKLYRFPELAQYTRPFGSFDTPQSGAAVSGSIPVSGWALDDQGIKAVTITRDPVAGEGNAQVTIGEAVFVEGARPDIAGDYPSYPYNYKAGWGYMLLTNALPNNGNGTFTLHAVATDVDGHQVTLGSRTITVDNANSVTPFGTIDTPLQGGNVSGDSYVNVGWALTPLPNTIPTEGSTITVWLDGRPLGHPDYNRYREDIAALFPGYNNSNGAVGLFELDTTAYANGVHTIAWSVTDDAGNSAGIGSRHFTIHNPVENGDNRVQIRKGPASLPTEPLPPPLLNQNPVPSVTAKKGVNRHAPVQTFRADADGIITIHLKPMERLELHLDDVARVSRGFMVSGGKSTPLPIGSSLDREKGIFYWQPGPGFRGEFPLVFVMRDAVAGASNPTGQRAVRTCRISCVIR